jgi:hypothetical protein
MELQTADELLGRLRVAAAPYLVRGVAVHGSMMPDLKFSDSEGREVMRLRWFDGVNQDPRLRNIIPAEISDAEARRVEAYIMPRITPVIQDRFSYLAWMDLAEPGRRSS